MRVVRSALYNMELVFPVQFDHCPQFLFEYFRIREMCCAKQTKKNCCRCDAVEYFQSKFCILFLLL